MAPGGLKLIPRKVVRKTINVKLQDMVEEIKERLVAAGEMEHGAPCEIRLMIDGKVRLLEDVSGGHEIRLAWES